MTVSIVVATYNWEKALFLSINSILSQSVLPDEIVIADDGSGDKTLAVVEQFRQKTSIPIIHVWHEDTGFRLSVIRNKAIARCTSDYIIQIDGDVVLHKDFIKDHVRFARPNSFVSGSRVKINQELTKSAIDKGVFNPCIFSKGISNKLNGLHLPILMGMYENHRQNDLLYVRGCNMAFWLKDLITVNGYDENMIGWGREDSEIACRLTFLGKRKRIIKFAGILYHLHHKFVSRTMLNINDMIFKKTIDTRITRCVLGVDQYLFK